MNQHVKELSDHLEDLPLLPTVIARMLNFSRDDDNYFEKVLPLARQDPSFALRIIRLANSSAFKSKSQVNDLHAAVARLGAYQVASLVTSMAVMQIFLPNKKDARSLWLHAIQVAIIAQAIAHRARMANHEVAYLCGLMHDIGRFILFDVASTDVRRIDESGWNSPAQLIDVEQKTLGIDHAELGWQICKKWEMPDQVSTIVRYHHRPNDDALHGLDSETQELTRLIHLADCFSVLLLTTLDIASMPSDEFVEQIQKRVIGLSSAKFHVSAADLALLAPLVIKASVEHCVALGLHVN